MYTCLQGCKWYLHDENKYNSIELYCCKTREYESGSSHLSSHLSSLTLAIAGAPQMTLQQYISTFLCLPLSSGNLQPSFLSIPWCYLPISSSVFLSFLLLSLSAAELSSPCQRILRGGHTIWVSVIITIYTITDTSVDQVYEIPVLRVYESLKIHYLVTCVFYNDFFYI